jgi:tetratricopeptide (TPR) repeat protein
MNKKPMSSLSDAARYQAAVSLYQSEDIAGALTTLGPLLEARKDRRADRAQALNLAAACALRLARKPDAERYWRAAIEADPRFAQAHYNLGVLLHGLGRSAQAQACYRDALAVRPDYLDAHNNLCALLKACDRFDDAEQASRAALSMLPDHPVLLHNLGTVLVELGRLAEAEAVYRKALAIEPNYADAKCKLGALLLSHGHFKEGWALFEARYDSRLSDRTALPPNVSYPQWRGESLQGKAVLVWQEQGFGDMIQFGRYLASLKALGAAWITLACAPVLHRLFGGLSGVDAVVDGDSELARAPYDYWTLPLSIAHCTGTTLDSIPTAVYLAPDSALVDKWQRKLAGLSRIKVGLVWKGHAGHGNDRHRSLPSLETLRPLLNTPAISFVSLQKGQAEAEARAFVGGAPILDAGPDIVDFADSAALISQLDLIISVDTAVAHLAGSLGTPCWVMLPATGLDWRWVRGRADSPWYPATMRLFRQPRLGEWGSVVEEVANACLQMSSGRGPTVVAPAAEAG